MAAPLVNKKYTLEKFPGKGGWTYAAIPEIPADKHAYFGWVRVKGSIDDHEFSAYHLMPMGNGKLFLPIKAAIRKKIKKEAGDVVHVILYEDKTPVDIPEELLDCFTDEPHLLQKFLSYTEAEKKAAIEFIYAAKKDETKIDRIAALIKELEAKS